MMTPDPAELERQHLADLLEAMMRCAFLVIVCPLVFLGP
jgi:hypothetical protein